MPVKLGYMILPRSEKDLSIVAITNFRLWPSNISVIRPRRVRFGRSDWWYTPPAVHGLSLDRPVSRLMMSFIKEQLAALWRAEGGARVGKGTGGERRTGHTAAHSKELRRTAPFYIPFIAPFR